MVHKKFPVKKKAAPGRIKTDKRTEVPSGPCSGRGRTSLSRANDQLDLTELWGAPPCSCGALLSPRPRASRYTLALHPCARTNVTRAAANHHQLSLRRRPGGACRSREIQQQVPGHHGGAPQPVWRCRVGRRYHRAPGAADDDGRRREHQARECESVRHDRKDQDRHPRSGRYDQVVAEAVVDRRSLEVEHVRVHVWQRRQDRRRVGNPSAARPQRRSVDSRQ